jgi:hypothetical protein
VDKDTFFISKIKNKLKINRIPISETQSFFCAESEQFHLSFLFEVGWDLFFVWQL